MIGAAEWRIDVTTVQQENVTQSDGTSTNVSIFPPLGPFAAPSRRLIIEEFERFPKELQDPIRELIEVWQRTLDYATELVKRSNT